MQDPFLGTVILFGGTFPPVGWQTCDGTLLDISQNDALFALIGTTYGGDGISNFAVPDLRGRIPVGQSPTYQIGMRAGSETVSLTGQQMPQHNHMVNSSSAVPGPLILPIIFLEHLRL
ncbi:MAG: tail fiber protein [Ferruginibacter sp.]